MNYQAEPSLAIVQNDGQNQPSGCIILRSDWDQDGER